MKKEDIKVPVSSGELIDKISILKIKKKKILNKSKLQNINNELSLLNKIYKNNFKKNKNILLYEKKLIKINKKLWEIEDKIRFLESKKNFNKESCRWKRILFSFLGFIICSTYRCYRKCSFCPNRLSKSRQWW